MEIFMKSVSDFLINFNNMGESLRVGISVREIDE
jgi:hypothetical protein